LLPKNFFEDLFLLILPFVPPKKYNSSTRRKIKSINFVNPSPPALSIITSKLTLNSFSQFSLL
jgi:hypothetical protein